MQCKNLELFKKTTHSYEVPFEKNGQATDITGWTIYFTVKVSMKDLDANAKISKKVTVHSNPLTGIALIELDELDTDIEEGSYYYSIDYKDDKDNIGTVIYGKLKIIKSVRNTKD